MPPKSYSFWEWRTDKGQVKPFTKEESILLEKAYKEYRRASFAAAPPKPAEDGASEAEKPVVDEAAAAAIAAAATVQVSVNGQTFTCNVADMTQKNDKTGKTCKIARIAGVGNNKKEKPEPKPRKQYNNRNIKEHNNGSTKKGEQSFNHKFAPKEPISREKFADSDDETTKETGVALGEKRPREEVEGAAGEESHE